MSRSHGSPFAGSQRKTTQILFTTKHKTKSVAEVPTCSLAIHEESIGSTTHSRETKHPFPWLGCCKLWYAFGTEHMPHTLYYLDKILTAPSTAGGDLFTGILIGRFNRPLTFRM